jgi:hypothetical protein
MQERLSAAQHLVRQGQYDEAIAEFEWLWQNMGHVEPAMNGVRVSLLARYIGKLVDTHPPARVSFTKLRDRAAIRANADHLTSRLRLGWIVLNEILRETEPTLAWFESVKDDERYTILLDRVAHRLVPLLKSRSRFQDIGRIYKDPVATLMKTLASFQAPPHIVVDPYPYPAPELSRNLQSLMRQRLQTVLDRLPKHIIEEAALMVTCLLAAGRIADAEAVEREARRLDPSEAMRAALENARGS